MHPVNNRFWKALVHRKYQLADNSSHQDDKVAQSLAKWTNLLEVQIRSKIFDSFDLICIPRFLSAFELALDTNGYMKGPPLWMLHFFMECPSAMVLNARIALKSMSHNSQKEGKVTLCCEAVNHLLKTYGTEVLIMVTSADMT